MIRLFFLGMGALVVLFVKLPAWACFTLGIIAWKLGDIFE